MKTSEKPSDADIAAEAGHFRAEAIRQELQTGKRRPLIEDPATGPLPPAMQVTHPTFLDPGDAEASAADD